MPKLFSVNLGAAEHRRLKVLAAVDGRSASDLCRELINAAWNKSPIVLAPQGANFPKQSKEKKNHVR
jgi:plasmid stability protein